MSSASHEMSRPAGNPPAERVGSTILGIGVNANVHSWKGGQLKPAIERYTALGPLLWRVIIDRGDWEDTQLAGSPADIDWEAYGKIYSAGKMADLWSTIRAISASPNQTIEVNIMGGVSQWMGGTRILPGKEDYWVRSVATMIAYGRNVEKLNFSLVGPMNEIDWNGIEGPQVPPEQYVRLMHKLIDRLDSMGLSDIRLVSPETADPGKGVSQYLPAIAADPLVTGRLAQWGLHTYAEDLGGAPAQLESSGVAAPVVVTEFSGPCPGCDDGAPNPDDSTTAIATAHQAISLLNQGADGLEFYDAWDGYYEHHGLVGYWGALAYDASTGTYYPRRTFTVLSLLSRCIHPGDELTQVDVSGPGADLSVAVKNPVNGATSVVILASESGGTARVSFAGNPAGRIDMAQADLRRSPDHESGTTTSSRPLDPSHGSFTVDLASASLVCLSRSPH